MRKLNYCESLRQKRNEILFAHEGKRKTQKAKSKPASQAKIILQLCPGEDSPKIIHICIVSSFDPRAWSLSLGLTLLKGINSAFSSPEA